MRYLISILSLFVISSISAQDTINQKDAQGLRQGKWIFYGKDRPESGISAEGKVEEGILLRIEVYKQGVCQPQEK